MTLRRTTAVLFGLLVAVGLVPMALTALLGDDSRHLDGVALSEIDYREVAFRNAEHGLDLAGMLLVPEGVGPFPGAIIIHGSGTSQRDSPWYLTVAEHLQSMGVVVLLPDKRGSEKSEGDWRTSSFEDLAVDTLAAIEFLESQSDVPIDTLGIIGMSQGGQIAPIVVSQRPELDYVVAMSSNAVSMHEQLLYEENHNLREMGILPGLSNVVAQISTRYIRNVAASEFWDVIGNFDSLTYWAGVDVPTLILYGADDTNVPTARSRERLRELGNPKINIVSYDASGHAIEQPPDSGNSIVRPEALQQLSRFIIEAHGREPSDS